MNETAVASNPTAPAAAPSKGHVTPGRIVFYVPRANDPFNDTRPAMVVRVWNSSLDATGHPGLSNLQVFLDGTNDITPPPMVTVVSSPATTTIAVPDTTATADSADVAPEVTFEGANGGTTATQSYQLAPVPTSFWATSIQYSETPEPGTWHWPARS